MHSSGMYIKDKMNYKEILCFHQNHIINGNRRYDFETILYISRRVQQKVHVLTVLEAKQRAMNTKSKT